MWFIIIYFIHIFFIIMAYSAFIELKAVRALNGTFSFIMLTTTILIYSILINFFFLLFFLYLPLCYFIPIFFFWNFIIFIILLFSLFILNAELRIIRLFFMKNISKMKFHNETFCIISLLVDYILSFLWWEGVSIYICNVLDLNGRSIWSCLLLWSFILLF